MDERLRSLERQAAQNDPESRRRHGRELMRSGIIYQHIDDFCKVNEYLEALEMGSAEDKELASRERHLIFSKLIHCLAPVDVVVLMRETDDGDSYAAGVFASRTDAVRWLSDWFMNVMHLHDLPQDVIDDAVTLHKQGSYDDIVSLINQETFLGQFYLSNSHLQRP